MDEECGAEVLVPDWDTKRVLLVLPTEQMEAYAPRLPELERFYAAFMHELARFEDVACLVPDAVRAARMMHLSGLGPDHFPRARLPDIWIRDFAPLCTRGRFVRFRYTPPHASLSVHRGVADAFAALLALRRVATRRETLTLDGGDLVHNGAGVGLATRTLVVRNRGLRATERVRRTLGLARLVLIPAAPGDRSGHADGVLRFAAPNLLLVNDYARLPGGSEFQSRLDGVLDRKVSDAIRATLPYRCSSGWPDGRGDARGNYATFLLTSQRVYAPIYDVPEDREAERVFESLFPGRVSYIHATAIARFGGSLNRITWNYA